jgi:hypothetical protein
VKAALRGQRLLGEAVMRRSLMGDCSRGGALLGGIVGLVVMLADRAFEASDQFVGMSMLGGIGVGALTLAVIFFLMASASEVGDNEPAATE